MNRCFTKEIGFFNLQSHPDSYRDRIPQLFFIPQSPTEPPPCGVNSGELVAANPNSEIKSLQIRNAQSEFRNQDYHKSEITNPKSAIILHSAIIPNPKSGYDK